MNPQLSLVFLHTADLERLERFYRDTLGLPEKYRDEGESVWFETGGVTLVLHTPEAGFGPGPFDPARGGVLLWLAVEQGIEERYRALQEAGVTIAVPLRSWPVRTLFCIQDPEGRRIGFVQSHSEPPPAGQPQP